MLILMWGTMQILLQDIWIDYIRGLQILKSNSNISNVIFYGIVLTLSVHHFSKAFVFDNMHGNYVNMQLHWSLS